MQHGHEVNIIPSQHLFNKLDEFFLKLLLALQPRSVEVETQGSAVAVEMTVEVVSEQAGELFSSLDVGARVDHVTTWKRFVEGWIITPVELVHHHFPYWMASAGAIVSVAVALVGHSEVERVRPDGHAAEGRGDRSIVHEELVAHHFKLLVAANAEVRRSDSYNCSISDVSESLDDQPGTSHFC